ncbi:MAG: RodZ domain-containing protein [Hyphomonadaceae bacterium]
MLQPTGSDSQPLENAPPARLRMTAREGRIVTIDPTLRAGKKLESAREQLGLTLEQVAGMTRVRREFLEALEEMDAKLLPGKAYALAYLRSYVRALGLDEAEILTQYQSEVALSREDAAPQVRSPSSRPRRKRPWVWALLVFLVAGGFMGWQALKDNFVAPNAVTPAQASATEAQPQQRTAQAGRTAQAVMPHGQVEIRALAEAHLEVRGPDGTIYLYRTLQPGEAYRPDPGPGWTVHARDGGAFEVSLDGASAGLLGEAGKPVLGLRIDSIEALTDGEIVAAP